MSKSIIVFLTFLRLLCWVLGVLGGLTVFVAVKAVFQLYSDYGLIEYLGRVGLFVMAALLFFAAAWAVRWWAKKIYTARVPTEISREC